MLPSLAGMRFRKTKADLELNLVRHVKGNKKGILQVPK